MLARNLWDDARQCPSTSPVITNLYYYIIISYVLILVKLSNGVVRVWLQSAAISFVKSCMSYLRSLVCLMNSLIFSPK